MASLCSKKIILPFLILKILSLKNLLEIMIQTYAIFYQRKLQKVATLMKTIWEKQQMKKIFIKIQTDSLLEQNMSLIA